MIAHTIFTASPFRPKGTGLALTPRRLNGVVLGGAVDDLKDLFGDFRDTVEGLTSGIDGLIEQLPVGVLRTEYASRQEVCLAKGTLQRYPCLYDLFQDVKDAIRDKDKGVSPTPTGGGRSTTTDTGSQVPWVPIAIAAGLGTGALVYFVLRK